MRDEANACRTAFAARVDERGTQGRRTEKATRKAAMAASAQGACRVQRRGESKPAAVARSGPTEAFDVRIQPAKQRFYQRRPPANLALSRSIEVRAG
jgi:hypothetical protein